MKKNSDLEKLPGLFISVEGIDGSGTTTFIKNLEKVLLTKNQKIFTTSEPTNLPVGNLIRQFLKGDGIIPDSYAYALLFAADRRIHFINKILPALTNKKIVITDRYILSSLAYQTIDGDYDWVLSLNSKVPMPHLTIFLDLNIENAQNRITKRGKTRDHMEQFDFQTKVIENYNKILNNYSGDILRIDASASPKIIVEKALKYLSNNDYLNT
jgi:dTMP kinase